MNAKKITDPPWEIDEIVPDCDIFITAHGANIAIVLGADNFPCLPPEDSSNFQYDVESIARLIAAAPDLLAACVALERKYGMGSDGFVNTVEIGAARVAIKKAKGGDA